MGITLKECGCLSLLFDALYIGFALHHAIIMLLSVKTHEYAEGKLCKHLFCNFMILKILGICEVK